MSNQSTTIPRQSTSVREDIRAELEETRAAYMDLLASLSESDWGKRSGNAAWTVGQLMWHLAWGLAYFPKSVEQCRLGRQRNPPARIMNPLNALITRVGSRGATPPQVAAKYDASHAALLRCLDGVQDDEWQKEGKPLGAFGARKTVEAVFRSVTPHFREHEADILKGLGRV